MFELMIFVPLLFPVIWYLGYRQGRSSAHLADSKSGSNLSNQYFTGLNYLLNEEPDKAIDTFVNMLQLDSETVETHLALGNLFRKRGEVDRAIRIHQNLIARPSLTEKERKLSLCELGLDYMSAGLFDRAEAIFKDLAQDPWFKNQSLKQLLSIYQQTRDWENAIQIAAKLSTEPNSSWQHEMAHFYCECAEQKRAKDQFKEAMDFVAKAIKIDPNSVRASIISGDLLLASGAVKKALRAYSSVISQDLEFLPEVVESIAECYRRLEDFSGFTQFLQDAIGRGAGIATILVYAEAIQTNQGDYQAAEYIAMQMKTHPSLKGLKKLIELHIKHSSDSARPSLLMLQDIVGQLIKIKPVYHCRQCGFASKSLFWQCPGCRCWGSVKPIQGIEGD